jgi:hypothetical protein
MDSNAVGLRAVFTQWVARGMAAADFPGDDVHAS